MQALLEFSVNTLLSGGPKNIVGADGNSRYRTEVFELCETDYREVFRKQRWYRVILTPSAITAGGVFLFPFAPQAKKDFKGGKNNGI